METPLLATKLNIPPVRPQIVPRPRLIEKLKEGLSYNLVLISAPAGFGKTTLVSEWIRLSQPQIQAPWVSLDEADNDPVRFWDYFIAALKMHWPATNESTSAMLHSPQPYPSESILTALINDLTTVSDDFAVVLDDYHLIKNEAIHAGMTFLLEHMPPKMHLIIATRVDPELPLSRFRGRGTMLEIGADDLRFTLDETGALLQGLLGVTLSPEDIRALLERTEGWVVGLKMAALSLRGQQDVRSFLSTFTGSQRYVMDYLMEEVLKQQSEQVQDFLLKTSVLERLSGSLCDFVVEGGDSAEMLRELERKHLFIVPLDESRQWYRYHHLFADLLRHQLKVKSGAKEVSRLHQRAGQWY